MTNATLENRSGRTDDARGRGSRRKTVLFCPVCGFDAPVDDGWVTVPDTDHRGLACPDCDTVVAVR